jgi:predicted  nucleic acid-binding Zn-ribbon protein
MAHSYYHCERCGTVYTDTAADLLAVSDAPCVNCGGTFGLEPGAADPDKLEPVYGVKRTRDGRGQYVGCLGFRD